MDFDRVADELYALPPGAFVAARDERAAAARAQGDRALSASIKKLRKPTTSAWLVNQLVRDRGPDVVQLVELGPQLRAAQRELAGDQLRELSQRRRTLVAALSQEAKHVGCRTGVPVSDSAVDEVAATLEAAVADPEAVQALGGGRLTSVLRYAGTGPLGGTMPPSASEEAPRTRGTEPTAGSARRRRDGAERKAGSAVKAGRAVKTAARRVAAAQREVAGLDNQLVDAGAAVEEAKATVRRLEQTLRELAEHRVEALRRLHEAEREERAAKRAEQGL